MGQIWDYSEGNVHEFGRRFVLAKHVPLGFAPFLEQPAQDASRTKDIDVLFYGKMNAYRWNLITELRERHGLRVIHANANIPAFGDRLNAAISRAKVTSQAT